MRHVTTIVLAGQLRDSVPVSCILLQARTYIESLPHYPKKDFHKFFVGANSVAINLLEQLLTMDPDRRPTAEQALEHPYFTKYHILEDEVKSDVYILRTIYIIIQLFFSFRSVCVIVESMFYKNDLEITIRLWRSIT